MLHKECFLRAMDMCGEDLQQDQLFSYGSLEQRVPADHPPYGPSIPSWTVS
jgi:hypothetical protein